MGQAIICTSCLDRWGDKQDGEVGKKKRIGVGFGGNETLCKPPSPKTLEERKTIAEAFRHNENMATMISLENDRLEEVIDLMWSEPVQQGTQLIEGGDWTANYFYVVQEGSFQVTVSRLELQQPIMSSRVVGHIQKGGSFGELALLTLMPRAATVTADVDSRVWVIDRVNFKKILIRASEEKISKYVQHLNRVELLNKLDEDEKRSVAEAMVEQYFQKGDVVIKQGDPGNFFFILYEGTISVTKDGNVVSSMDAAKSAQVIGERALLTTEPRAATITVTSKTAKALAMDRDAFELLLGPLHDNMRQASDRTICLATRMINKKGVAVGTAGPKVRKADLTKIALLGCGGFGTVELWENKTDGNAYALKTLSKGFIVKTGAQKNVMTEKNIMMMIDSPFVVKLYACYNEAQTVSFLLELALGGEIWTLYRDENLHGSVKHARYYAAGVTLAFAHLHALHIIYRDLKPENLLVDTNGFLKVADFGLAKCTVAQTYTACGTPEYFAPEVIASTGHTSAVDWWTLGIIIFEWLTGSAPFEAANPLKIFEKVKRGIDKVKFPEQLKVADVGLLIKAILKENPSERLPCRLGGVDNIKNHAWYLSFDWSALANQQMQPPYVPALKGATDASQFQGVSVLDMPPTIPYTDDGSNWDAEFAF